MSRSLTLLCHNAYSDAYLQHQLELNPNGTHLQAHWKQQKPLCSQDYMAMDTPLLLCRLANFMV